MRDGYDVLVVGAGPAGLAAATAAARHGARVGLLDAQARVGGQIWRHDVTHAPPATASRAILAAENQPGIQLIPQATVVAAERNALLVEDPRTAYWLGYRHLVLATGARELLLPFPGWTLPGVIGAGGLQALAKQGWPLTGKRVVIAGSGPLLLAAAATARRHGAKVLGIFEQTTPAALHRFATGLWRWPGKLAQAVRLRRALWGIPYRSGHLVARALGANEAGLQAVEIESATGIERLDCELLAVGYGLVPNLELARLLGCATEACGMHTAVRVDAEQRSSLPQVYAAGEACGIGGVDCARVEGAIAGLAAAGAPIPAALHRRRARARTFAAALRRDFALRPRVHALATPDTLICRCEDVPLSALDGHADARSAKLATRCGMGACQGRICGTALAELGRFAAGDLRPPLFPTRLASLAEADPPSPLNIDTEDFDT